MSEYTQVFTTGPSTERAAVIIAIISSSSTLWEHAPMPTPLNWAAGCPGPQSYVFQGAPKGSGQGECGGWVLALHPLLQPEKLSAQPAHRETLPLSCTEVLLLLRLGHASVQQGSPFYF